MSESEPRDRGPAEAAIGSEAIAERISEQAATHRDRELERALDRLRGDGELTDAQRRAVETLAHSLTDRLLSAPREAILSADDPEMLTAALTIFDPGE